MVQGDLTTNHHFAHLDVRKIINYAHLNVQNEYICKNIPVE